MAGNVTAMERAVVFQQLVARVLLIRLGAPAMAGNADPILETTAAPSVLLPDGPP